MQVLHQIVKKKLGWVSEYYDSNFDTQNIFLFVYFAEKNTDNDVGYMCYSNGYETSSIMDSEAIEIFWNYIDKYWYSNMSTDDMITTVFNKTADTIMRVSTTGMDVLKIFIIGVVIVSVLIGIIYFFNLKRKAEKEKAAETERILNTPMQDLVDDLTKKYD